jgi:hypothetical protein
MQDLNKHLSLWQSFHFYLAVIVTSIQTPATSVLEGGNSPRRCHGFCLSLWLSPSKGRTFFISKVAICFIYLYGRPFKNHMQKLLSILFSFLGSKVIQLCSHILFLGAKRSQSALCNKHWPSSHIGNITAEQNNKMSVTCGLLHSIQVLYSKIRIF